MGMRMPETCWAVFKRQVINLRSCCVWLVDSVERKNVIAMLWYLLGSRLRHWYLTKSVDREGLSVAHSWLLSLNRLSLDPDVLPNIIYHWPASFVCTRRPLICSCPQFLIQYISRSSHPFQILKTLTSQFRAELVNPTYLLYRSLVLCTSIHEPSSVDYFSLWNRN